MLNRFIHLGKNQGYRNQAERCQYNDTHFPGCQGLAAEPIVEITQNGQQPDTKQ